jgi:hypothetical protein
MLLIETWGDGPQLFENKGKLELFSEGHTLAILHCIWDTFDSSR